MFAGHVMYHTALFIPLHPRCGLNLSAAVRYVPPSDAYLV